MLVWLVLFFTLGFFWCQKTAPRPYFGIYNRPGKWFYLKAIFIYLSIQWRKYQAKQKERSDARGNEQAGYGVSSGKDILSMERAQPLSNHPLAIDAILFSSSGKDGSYLVAAQARRQLRMNNTIFCLRIPSVGVLVHPKHPDTTMFTDCENSWHVEGLQMDLVDPMKKWKLSYQGPMLHQSKGTTHQVTLKAEYTSNFPYFDFDSDMDPWTIAKAMAREPWSKAYFENVRKAHQNHYEQLGEIHGSVKIDAIEYPLNLHVMRDHTHGSIRDWRLMHRYGIQSFTTENGFRGFLGTVCQPGTFSNLELGYVMTSDGQCAPVEEVDLPLWAHGEGGQHPEDFAFRFKAQGIWHEIQVKVLDSVEVFMGWEWEGRVLERFCRYTVDGVPGWGVSEWHFRHRGGRPKELAAKDPEYTQNVAKFPSGDE